MREFGIRVEGVSYIERPSAYVVLFDGAGRVAMVETPRGALLPGGGADPGESPEDAVKREALEECGFTLTALRPIGHATEFVHAEGEGHFAKTSTFFRAVVLGARVTPTEPDHLLRWVDRGDVRERISHGSHAWAVKVAIGEGLSDPS